MNKIEVPEWAIEIAANHFDFIEPNKTALVVIDMQNAFMVEGQPWSNPHARDIVPNINRLAEATRVSGGLVVWTRNTYMPAMAPAPWLKVRNKRPPFEVLSPGRFGYALYEGLAVAPVDLIIDKHTYSAFNRNSSDIELRLRERGIDTLLITGTVTNGCCESTARDAHMLGFKVLFTQDATAAFTDEEHNAALLSMTTIFADVRSTQKMLDLIRLSTDRGALSGRL